jgi:hypothetical protein
MNIQLIFASPRAIIAALPVRAAAFRRSITRNIIEAHDEYFVRSSIVEPVTVPSDVPSRNQKKRCHHQMDDEDPTKPTYGLSNGKKRSLLTVRSESGIREHDYQDSKSKTIMDQLQDAVNCYIDDNIDDSYQVYEDFVVNSDDYFL